jgi:hypothetical protein
MEKMRGGNNTSVRKPGGKRPLGRRRSGCDDNIKMRFVASLTFRG